MNYITHKKAEQLAEIKLDGRRKYFMWGGIVCVEDKFTQACSGCSDDSEYSNSSRGFGCRECGGHGVCRSSFPCPVNPKQVN